MSTTTYSAGIATAYGAAVRGGYTGTYQQFCADLANLPGVVETLENLSASATTLPEGSSATASYSNGNISFGIPKGDTGAAGATGATGATGNGIASIAKTSTVGLVDTYTITFTDGTTTTFEVTNGQDGEVTQEELEEALKLDDYDDLVNIIKIDSTTTTLGNIAAILNSVNNVGDHVFFDMSALGVMMYLCTIFIDTSAGQYKVFDLVSGRYAEGAYDATMLLTMATAQANGLAVQSQIDHLQKEIDELGGKSVLDNWDVLGDKIADGTSLGLIDPGDTIDVNWIKSVLGTTTSGLTVLCTDMDAFVRAVGEAEASNYLFVFDGVDWNYAGSVVDLDDFGLSVAGIPATGEVMTIVTTVNSVSYTFTGYDDINPADPNVPHNWLLEQTYAPDQKAYDTYESMFCVQKGKTVPAGKYYLPLYSYRSGKSFNACFMLSTALGSNDYKIQMRRNASESAARTASDGTSKTDVYAVTSMLPIIYGTVDTLGPAVAVTYLSDADAASGGYTLLSTLNTDANDPVYTPGDMDQAALGDNGWAASNLRQWLNSDMADGGYDPTHDNDIASAYNRTAGYLWGMDPRVRSLIQYAEVLWTAGYGNPGTHHSVKATGTAPSSDAPIYYARSGDPGNRTYVPLDPQPTSGADVSGYYIYADAYIRNKTYISEDRVFLLSMKEMSFDINTSEGNISDLYGEYTDDTLTNGAVAARAKYNKAGGSLNNYRWSRSANTSYAYIDRYVTSTGSISSYGSTYGSYYYAPAFILGKSTNQ